VVVEVGEEVVREENDVVSGACSGFSKVDEVEEMDEEGLENVAMEVFFCDEFFCEFCETGVVWKDVEVEEVEVLEEKFLTGVDGFLLCCDEECDGQEAEKDVGEEGGEDVRVG
jgi:hypothetical protein